MTQIGWNEAIPSITSTVGSFPPYAKSVWTGIATGMSVEHLWDGTGGASAMSRGDLRPGGSRAFFAAQSASSSSFTGKLFFASNVSRLFAYGSNGTYLVGSPFFSDESVSTVAQSGVSAPSFTTCFRLRQSGTTLLNIASSTVTFPVPYISPPRVVVTSSNTSFMVFVSSSGVTNTSFGVGATPFTWIPLGIGIIGQVVWEAIGYVSSASY